MGFVPVMRVRAIKNDASILAIRLAYRKFWVLVPWVFYDSALSKFHALKLMQIVSLKSDFQPSRERNAESFCYHTNPLGAVHGSPQDK